MSKKLFTATFFVLFVCVSYAQPHQHRDYQKKSQVEFASSFERFWLYLNNRPYNSRPEKIVTVTDFDASEIHNVRIIMDNPQRDEISENIAIHGDNAIVRFDISRGKNPHSNYALWLNERPIHADRESYIDVWQEIIVQVHSDIKRLPAYTHTAVEPLVLPSCSETDFRAIMATIDRQNFSSDKMIIAKQAIPGKALTAAQIAQIAQKFNMDSDRIEFLKFAYRHCFDPENYYLVFNSLTYSSSKEELKKYLK